MSAVWFLLLRHEKHVLAAVAGPAKAMYVSRVVGQPSGGRNVGTSDL